MRGSKRLDSKSGSRYESRIAVVVVVVVATARVSLSVCVYPVLESARVLGPRSPNTYALR